MLGTSGGEKRVLVPLKLELLMDVGSGNGIQVLSKRNKGSCC